MSKPTLLQAPSAVRFRSAPTRTPKLGVDREAGVINGCSAIMTGEALGHGMLVDQKTCEMVVALGNAAGPSGVKSRFGHPGMCSDSLGTLLGHASNFRLEKGDGFAKALHDIKIAESAKIAPQGDLSAYVLKMAEESPKDLALSIVFSGPAAWKLDDDTEMDEDDDSLRRNGEWGSYFARPDNAVGEMPYARPKVLHASDMVGEPAANADGLFASFAAGAPAAQAFADLDALLARAGVPLERAAEFATTYLSERSHGRIRLAAIPSRQPAGVPAPPSLKGKCMTPEQLKSLKAKHPDHAGLLVDMFAEGKSEAECLSIIATKDSEAQVAALAAEKTKTAELAAELKTEKDKSTKLAAELETEKAKVLRFQRHGTTADPGGAPPKVSETATDEAGWKAEFAASPDLREEFGGDESAYIAYSKGVIRTSKKKG